VQLKTNFVTKAYPSFGDTEQVPMGGETKLTPNVTDAFVLLGEKPAQHKTILHVSSTRRLENICYNLLRRCLCFCLKVFFRKIVDQSCTIPGYCILLWWQILRISLPIVSWYILNILTAAPRLRLQVLLACSWTNICRVVA